MTVIVYTPKDYTNADVDSIVTGNAVNVFSFIPSSLQSDILKNVCTVDVSSYLNAAHTAAGIGGKVFYPPGTYPCSLVAYREGQGIFGSGGSATILSKVGLIGSAAHSILVSYNWLNDIPTQENGVEISGIGFLADSTSTDGYAIVCMSRRPRILDCNIVGDAAGLFGGMYFTTNTTSRTPINNNNNLAGAGVSGNAFSHLRLGGVVGKSTSITAITANVSITLNRTTVGAGGTFTTYQDANSNVNFTGTSNGTNVILVANTTGLAVGDQVRFGDIFNDLITDFYLTGKNTLTDCGSLDGTIYTLDSPNMNGWNIVGNKFNAGPGGHFNCIGNCHSLLVSGNLIDYAPTNPIATNYCMNLQIDQSGLCNVVGNQFKCRSIADNAPDAYRIIYITPSYTTQTSTNNVCSSNSFDMPKTPTDFKAFHVVNSAQISGVASGNSYQGLMSATQKGNGDTVWQEPVVVTTGLTAHAGGGQGSATALSYGMNEVQVCATNGDSVLLPAATGTGRWVDVGNSGAASCNVFPATGGAINRGSANAAVAVAAAAGKRFTDIATGQWRAIP